MLGQQGVSGGFSPPVSELHNSSLPLYEGHVTGRANRPEKFTIDLALACEQQAAACRLLNERYGWRGYGSEHRFGQETDTTTFAASVGNEVVGTLSLTVDSPAGLAADAGFADLLDEMRAAPGTKLCELTKFAVAKDLTSLHLLASLFHTIFIFGVGHYDCTDLVIEVNPRHVRFYEVMLDFDRVGHLRNNESVGAPAQLMRLKVADIARHIQRHVETGSRAGRSLYPYFLTAAQECLIQERMACLDERWPFSAQRSRSPLVPSL